MSTNERSAFIRELNKHKKDLTEAAKEQVASGFMTDEEIIESLELSETKKQFITKVSRVRYGLDKNKNPYFAFNFTITQGEHTGVTVSQFIGLSGKTKEQKQRANKRLCGTLQRLDYDTTKWTAANVSANAVEAADELTAKKPGVRLSLSTWGDDNDRLNIDIIGMAPSGAEGSVSLPEEKATPKAPKPKASSTLVFEDIGAKADEEDEDAISTLEGEAAKHDLDPNDFETWVDLGVRLDSLASETSSDDSINYSEYVGYEATFDSDETGEITVTTTAYDDDSGLFTVEDEEGTEYELAFSDLDFGE